MKRNNLLKSLLISLLTIGICLGLSSCFEETPEETPSYNREAVIINTEVNEDGELIVYFEDGSIHNAGRIENNQTSITVSSNGNDVSSATAKGLMSAVSIKSNFVSKTSGFFPGFGITGGSGNEYYGCGSGVIFKLNGDEAFIITNHHVVYDSGSRGKNGISEDIELYLFGREDERFAISAEYVGGSEYYDLAVLYAKDPAFKSGIVKAAEFSDEEVSVGQTAIAIGNPQGLGISASLGIVSVDSEYILTSTVNLAERAIRVDTAVNAGNSGGGLYDNTGKLIGIVNAKIVDSSVENIGYAIPASVVVAVKDNIMRNCYGKNETAVKRAMLGITLEAGSSTAVLDEKGNIDIVQTVTVGTVEKGSLADGRLKKGDILISAKLGDREIKITRVHHIIDFMIYANVGDTLVLTVKSEGEIKTLNIPITSSSIADH